jgi:RimJ/RimL family protein N-acetyltransferase
MNKTGGALTQVEAEKQFQRSLKANERAKVGGKKSVLTWAILHLDTGIIIGSQTLSFLTLPHNIEVIKQTELDGIVQAEVGIVLSIESQRKGLGKEALAALVAYGFKSLSLDRINAYYVKSNFASARSFARLNFICDSSSQLKNIEHCYLQVEITDKYVNSLQRITNNHCLVY